MGAFSNCSGVSAVEDASLDKQGKLIRWTETPRCTECFYRDNSEDRCRLQRCRWRDKRPSEYGERQRVTRERRD